MSHHAHTIDAGSIPRLPASSLFAKLPIIGGLVGLGALGAALATGMGAAETRQQLWHSYLVAYLYWLSIALGGLFFTLVQYATRAGWSIALRRVFENVAATLPLFLVLFIPVILGMHDLYHHWLDHDVVANDPILLAKAPYLNEKFFFIRAAIYFAVWIGLALMFYRGSVAQDQTGDRTITRRLNGLSFVGIALFALTTTFAAFDWIMSLDPHWFSTMYGVYFFAGCVVGFFAFLSVITVLMRQAGHFGRFLTEEHQHDAGKLLFAFCVFWTYISFSQYFLIWYGDMPEETIFYRLRQTATWQPVSTFLVAGHFFVPFFFLMSRHVKRHRFGLLGGGLWIMLMHYVDLHWQVMPNINSEAMRHHAGHGFHLHLLDGLTFVGVGGLFLAAFGMMLGRSTLVPARDPRLAESAAFQNA